MIFTLHAANVVNMLIDLYVLNHPCIPEVNPA